MALCTWATCQMCGRCSAAWEEEDMVITVYKLTALMDLRYKLKERPTERDHFSLKKDKSLCILKEALPLFYAIDPEGKRTKAGIGYTLIPHR